MKYPVRRAAALVPFLASAFLLVLSAGASAQDSGGPTLAFECTVAPDLTGTRLVVTWDDIGARGYDVVADGDRAGRVWITDATSYSDATPATTDYLIVAFGNGTDWTEAECDVPDDIEIANPELACRVNSTPGGVEVTWNDIGAKGYDVIDIDNQTGKVWVSGTRYFDTSPGSNYVVVAFGNGTDGTTSKCNLLTGEEPGFEFTCAAVSDSLGGVLVFWNDIGAKGYDVIEGSEPKQWTTKTNFYDPSGTSDYKVVAFGNGTDWATAECVGR